MELNAEDLEIHSADAKEFARQIFHDQVITDVEHSAVFLGPALSEAVNWVMSGSNVRTVAARLSALVQAINEIATYAIYGWQINMAFPEWSERPSVEELAKRLVDQMRQADDVK